MDRMVFLLVLPIPLPALPDVQLGARDLTSPPQSLAPNGANRDNLRVRYRHNWDQLGTFTTGQEAGFWMVSKSRVERYLKSRGSFDRRQCG